MISPVEWRFGVGASRGGGRKKISVRLRFTKKDMSIQGSNRMV